MANENAKNFVEKYVLNDGEKVLWEGRPKSIKFFEEPHTTLNIIRWAISAILVFCAFKYWAYGSAISIEANVHVGTTLFLLFCAALIAIRPFLNIRNLQNRIHYIITDKRVIAYRKKDSETAFIQCRNLKDFTEATIVSKEGNLGDLYIGPKTSAAVRSSRRDLPPVQREEDYVLPMVLYNIFLPEEAAAFLPDYIKVNNEGLKSEKKAA